MKNCFTGQRVRLRAFEPEDMEIWAAEDKNRDTEKDRCDDMIQLPRAAWKLKEDFPTRLRREGEMETFRFIIENLEGEAVGSINAHSVDARMGTFSYGLGVYHQHRHKGYASEAVLLLMRFYFMELRMHKCNVAVYAFNEASLGLHDHLGFVREGVRRECCYTKGRYWDDVEFGMTRAEFEGKYPQFSQEG
jgi:RimJ/RimL family protein N-acetyltransferase